MPGSAQNSLILFTHIPKTAGNTLNSEFRRVFGDRAMLTTQASMQAEIRSHQSGHLVYIAGHVTYPQLSAALSTEASDRFYVSLIRDPLRRVISLYLLFLRNTVPGMDPFRDLILGK